MKSLAHFLSEDENGEFYKSQRTHGGKRSSVVRQTPEDGLSTNDLKNTFSRAAAGSPLFLVSSSSNKDYSEPTRREMELSVVNACTGGHAVKSP